MQMIAKEQLKSKEILPFQLTNVGRLPAGVTSIRFLLLRKSGAFGFIKATAYEKHEKIIFLFLPNKELCDIFEIGIPPIQKTFSPLEVSVAIYLSNLF